MMYWDTSCVLKLYAWEPDSEYWTKVAADRKGPLLSSTLMRAELAYALRAKENRKELKTGGAQQLFDRFASDIEQGWFRFMGMTGPVMERAVAFSMQPLLSNPPRTLDGLHLAAAVEWGCDEMATADRKLIQCAHEAGLQVITTADGSKT